jgi:hypothetical protein
MGSKSKLTKTRRRMKAARKVELRTKRAVKSLNKLHKAGLNVKVFL